MTGIEKNRRRSIRNTYLIVVLIIAVAANAFYSHHSLEECENRLHKKLFGKDAPDVGGLR